MTPLYLSLGGEGGGMGLTNLVIMYEHDETLRRQMAFLMTL